MLKRAFFLRLPILPKPMRFVSSSFLSPDNVGYAEEMYQKWITDSKSVHPTWDSYFKNSKDLTRSTGKTESSQLSEPSGDLSQEIKETPASLVSEGGLIHKVSKLIQNFRSKGHLMADTNPLGSSPGLPLHSDYRTRLTPEGCGITAEEMNIKIQLDDSDTFGLNWPDKEWTPAEVFETLKSIYCGKIAFQYEHIMSQEIIDWIHSRIERASLSKSTPESKLDLLERILQTEAFSLFCERKYSSDKRFDISGLDSAISGLGHLIAHAQSCGVGETILGMAHRGRLNTLACVIKKPLEDIFAEFEDKDFVTEHANIPGFLGDVKYHLGYTNKLEFQNGGEMLVNLMPNPSHLESVYPVVLGFTRACQEKVSIQDKFRILSVVIHGDASITGQGVTYEAHQLEKLEGYEVEGTIHLVFNNQIGFTTDQLQARSSLYPTSIALTNENFVIHVNADDPESVDIAMEIAIDYRLEFKSDVFINIIGYRRFGHSEQDSPVITQPEMYAEVSNKPLLYQSFGESLIAEKIITGDYLDQRLNYYKSALEKHQKIAQQKVLKVEENSHHHSKERPIPVLAPTGVSKEELTRIGLTIFTLPDTFNYHPVVHKIYRDRIKFLAEGKNIDFATAEALAFATLIEDGRSVRVTGEDVERGTFSHRHAVIIDQKTYKKFIPLKQIVDESFISDFSIYNSPLSEFATLGFEYGYSIASPSDLTIWEAQYGDFVNEAQVVIDQFVTASYQKWAMSSSLTLFLPHGYDGEGPDHSNAHLERFLAAVLDDYLAVKKDFSFEKSVALQANMVVCNVSTPANLFHLLRKQILTDQHKPLILMSPKRLLRHKAVRSSMTEFTESTSFISVYDEILPVLKENIERVLICSGQIYYDLLEQRQANNIANVSIVRLEQLGPFPYAEFKSIISTYDKNVDLVFVSEEPMNYGAWSFVKPRIDLVTRSLGMTHVRYVGRPASAATATASHSKHKIRQMMILKEAFDF